MIWVIWKDYYIDLLFYNTKLRCYIVIELKNTDFKPEYAGKLNFYLSAVDDMLKHEQDNPSIGILLCKERDKLTAEYALKDINKPIIDCLILCRRSWRIRCLRRRILRGGL